MLFSDRLEVWSPGELRPPVTLDKLTRPHPSLLVLGDEILTGKEVMLKLGLSHRPTFLYTYLQPTLKNSLIEMTIPDKPNSRMQKYRLPQKERLCWEILVVERV